MYTRSFSSVTLLLLFLLQEELPRVGVAAAPVGCLSPNRTDAVYTATSGELISDADGEKSAVGYDWQHCVWTIECPVGSRLGIHSLRGRLERSDYLLLNDTTKGELVGAVFSGPSGYWLSGNKGQVVFETHSSVGNVLESNYGFRLSWKCAPATCRNSNTPDGTTLTAPSLGKYTTKNITQGSSWVGERCHWWLQCPAGTHVLVKGDGWTLENSPTMTLSVAGAFSNGTTVTQQHWSGTFPSVGVVLPTHTAKVTFSDDALDDDRTSFTSTRLKQQGGPYFTVTFECLALQCSSPNASTSAGTTIVANSGRLVSGIAGEGTDESRVSSYHRNERCGYRIGCPSNTSSLLFLTIRGSTYSFADEIRVYRVDEHNGTATTGALVRRVYGRVVDNVWKLYVANASALMVNFTSSLFSLGAPLGWTLDWSCASPPANASLQCLSPNTTGATIVRESALLVSDAAGGLVPTSSELSGYTYSGQDCRWNVQCPTAVDPFRSLNILLEWYPSTNTNTASVPWSPAGGLSLLSLNSSSTLGSQLSMGDGDTSSKRIALWSEPSLQIRFQPPVTLPVAPRWKLKYFCARRRCSSRNTARNLTARQGTIQSDLDGYRSAVEYQPDEDCRWSIYCPVGTKYLALHVRLSVNEDDNFTVFGLDTGKSYVGKPLSVCPSCLYAGEITEALLNETNVEVRFSSVSTSKSSRSGFSLEYNCLPSKCVSPNASGSVFTAIQGRILSDRDGYAVGHTMYSSESCLWDIQCPSGHSVAFTSMRYRAGGIPLKVFTTSSTGWRLLMSVNNTAGFRTSEVFSGIDRVSIVYEEIAGTTYSYRYLSSTHLRWRGFTLEYKCLPPNNACIESPLTVRGNTSGVLASDFDGNKGEYRQTGGQQCQWAITCDPAGKDMLLYLLHYDDELSSADGFRLSTSSATIRSASNTVTEDWTPNRSLYFTSARTYPLEYSNLPARGAVLYYTCQPSGVWCYSPNRSNAEYLGSGTEERQIYGYEDPHDMVQKHDLCAYFIRCPSQYAFVWLNLSTGGEVNQQFSYSSAFSSPFAQQSVGNGRMLLRVDPLLSPTVTVHYAGVSGYRKGWTLGFRCVSVQCISPQSNQSRQANPQAVIRLSESKWQSLQSHEDSSSMSRAVMGSRCSWTVQCPSVDQHIELDYSIRKAHPAPPHIVFYESSPARGTNRTVLFTVGVLDRSETSLRGRVMLPRQAVDVEQTEIDMVTYGYSLKFKCASARRTCPSIVASSVNGSSGSITSDADGMSGYWRYAAGTRCQWSVSCPDPTTQSLEFTYRGVVGNDRDVPWLNLSDPNSSSPRMLRPFVIATASDYSFRQGTAEVHWHTTEGSLSTFKKRGFSLAYQCINKLPRPTMANSTVPSLCTPQNGIHTTGTVSVWARFLMGAGPRCVWQLQCQDPAAQSVLVRGESRSLETIRFSFFDESGERLLYSTAEVTQLFAFTFSKVRTVLVAADLPGGMERSNSTISLWVALTLTCLPWDAGTRYASFARNSAPQSMLLPVGPNLDLTYVYVQEDGHLLNVTHAGSNGAQVTYTPGLSVGQEAIPSPLGQGNYITIASGGPSNSTSLQVIGNYTFPLPVEGRSSWDLSTSVLIIRVVTSSWSVEQQRESESTVLMGKMSTGEPFYPPTLGWVARPFTPRGSKSGAVVAATAGVLTLSVGLAFLAVLALRKITSSEPWIFPVM